MVQVRYQMLGKTGTAYNDKVEEITLGEISLSYIDYVINIIEYFQGIKFENLHFFLPKVSTV